MVLIEVKEENCPAFEDAFKRFYGVNTERKGNLGMAEIENQIINTFNLIKGKIGDEEADDKLYTPETAEIFDGWDSKADYIMEKVSEELNISIIPLNYVINVGLN